MIIFFYTSKQRENERGYGCSLMMVNGAFKARQLFKRCSRVCTIPNFIVFKYLRLTLVYHYLRFT
ncbi:hypothetical protein Hanom_Chr16g01426811 [Helianthus anomalus]